ncbi:MAG TPA: hypothetical protein VED63_12800 [Acidimicrobiales bacterium]|nr:hypothetical protein [Acidimicrobiales bacterium]
MVLVSDDRRATPGTGELPPALRHGVEGRGDRGRRHPWRRIVIAIGAVAALVLASIAYAGLRYELRPHPGAKSVGSAVKSFHDSAPDAGAGRGGAYALPAAGVYTLRGQGDEHISFPPNSQRDGAAMPGTVTSLNGDCWRWRIDYNVAHSEEFVFCTGRAGLFQPTDINSQSWNFGVTTISNTARITCPASTVVLPARPTPGQTWQWSCPETNTSIGGKSVSTTTARIVGDDTVAVGGTPVAAVSEVQRTTVTGVQNGTVTEDWWFSRTSGLALRVERAITIHTTSPLGVITYTEDGSWQLSSLTPRQ